jgi:hypothetical protein
VLRTLLFVISKHHHFYTAADTMTIDVFNILAPLEFSLLSNLTKVVAHRKLWMAHSLWSHGAHFVPKAVFGALTQETSDSVGLASNEKQRPLPVQYWLAC